MTILPQLERDLHEAARERLPAEPPRGRPPRRAALATLVGVAVALLVALLAVALPGGHRPAARRSASAQTASVQLHRLLARFSVFRRHQTAADRAWQPLSLLPPLGAASVKLLPGLTRLAGELQGGERVFLTVGRVVRPALGVPPGSLSVSVWVVSPDGTQSSGARVYPADPYDAGLPAVLTASPYDRRFPAGGAHAWIGVSLVPDGVTAVGWAFQGRGLSILAFVGDNVAAARVAERATVLPSQVVWHGSHGQVVRTFNPTQPMDILFGDGIAGARFGESVSRVVASLDPVLGWPTRSLSAFGACGVDDTVTWDELVAFFKRGRFVGYAYGSQAGPSPPPPVLATARGLELGDTVAQARHVYGGAFQTSEEQGGTWFLTTHRGTLSGFTNSTNGKVTPQSTIATIQAGPRICAALSP